MKVAIVCDWLLGTGGAERVVLELHHMFPEAPIYTSQYNSDPKIWYGGEWFKKADVRTTWLQSLPKALKKFLPLLRARAFSHLHLSDYDLVISASGAEAKGVMTGQNTIHISYCHAPTHYYWSRYDEYMQNPGFGFLDPLARLGLRWLVGPMRKWDYKAAQRPDYFIANSKYTKDQIKKYYARDAEVVYPPVDVERFKPGKAKLSRYGFVAAGRQTHYKRIDLAVAACTELDIPLKVIGNGPDHKKLVDIASPRVTFYTNTSDQEMAYQFQQAEVFIFPGVDDFGIVAVEAMAAGTPVIAYKAGGALDYIKEGKNGLFFAEQTVESLVEVIEKFSKHRFNSGRISKQADRFKSSVFRAKMQKIIDQKIK